MPETTHAGTIRRGLRIVARGAMQEKPVFAAAVVGSAAYGIGVAGGGWLLGHVVETVLTPAFAAGRIETADLLRATGLMALVAVITALGVATRRVAAGVTMYRLQARYRRALTRQYLRLPLQWHHRHPAGQLLSIANADAEATWQVFAPLPMALGVAVMLLVAVIAMFAADPVLAVIGLLVLPMIVLANAWYQRRMSAAVMRAQALRAEVSDVAHESFEAATVVKTLGREAAETDRFGATAWRLRDANVEVGRLRSQFDPLMEALPTVGTLMVLAVGAWRVSHGDAAVGDLVQVAYLLTLVAFPLRATGWVLGELPRTVVGWERMSIVLDAGKRDTAAASGEDTSGSDEPMAYGPGTLPGSGAVGLGATGVHYAYSGHDGERFPVLHDVNFEITAGRTVAVVGPTGSGKSTLGALLVRLVDPADGQVLLDGVDLRSLRAGGVAEAAAFVPQSTFVFADSVRDNVRLGDTSIDDETVWRALDVARAARFVRALPEGLDTVIGERGATLSGGQRQRLVLARALVRSPRLLVLDDATSAIDPRVEAEILAGLRPTSSTETSASAARSAVTVLVVAYRRATIALADEVVYVEGGRVLDRGTHDELLARSDGYRRLVTAYDTPDDPPGGAPEFEDEQDESLEVAR